MSGVLYLAIRFRVWPSTVRRAIDNFGWRMNAIGASTEEFAQLFSLMLQANGRAWMVETANGPRVPSHWFDDPDRPDQDRGVSS